MPAGRDLKRLQEAPKGRLVSIIERLIRAQVTGAEGSRVALLRELQNLGVYADLLGRYRLLDQIRRSERQQRRERGEDYSLPEAISDLLEREPVLATVEEEVREAYRRRAFTLVRATEFEVVKRVQQAIAQGLQVGVSAADGAALVQELGDWSAAYAETVWRTNATTAYSAGRLRQASTDPTGTIVALEYQTAGDVDVRSNHRAANGVIGAPDDPVWGPLSPALGFNCRCSLRPVGHPEAKRRGLLLADGSVRPAKIPQGAGRDPGFVGSRPDVLIYG